MGEANHSQHERYIFGYDVVVPSIEEIEDKLYAWKGIVAVILLSPMAGFMAAASLPFSGSFLVDGVIFTALPWVFWLLVFRVVRLARARRFGPEHCAHCPHTGRISSSLAGATLPIGPYLRYNVHPARLRQP